MFCDNEATKYYLLGFMNSKVAMSLLNILSPSMGFESGYLRKLPIIESNHKDEVVNKVKNVLMKVILIGIHLKSHGILNVTL